MIHFFSQNQSQHNVEETALCFLIVRKKKKTRSDSEVKIRGEISKGFVSFMGRHFMESGNHPNARKCLTNGNATDRVRNSRETNFIQ